MTPQPEANQAPEVSAVDLRAVWTKIRDVQAHGKPGELTSLDFRPICSPDANVQAVWARTLILQILNHVVPGWSKNANMDKVFELAARFPMKIMEPGVQYDEPPFDVREFMKQLAAS